MKPEDLNEETMKRMEEAMECFVQQYGQYDVIIIYVTAFFVYRPFSILADQC
jgi:hypothetical protein